jgi:hypothetical protein
MNLFMDVYHIIIYKKKILFVSDEYYPLVKL